MQCLRGFVVGLAALALGACATATVVPVGTARAPIDPSQVRVYAQPPAHFEVVGILNGNSNIEGTGQQAVSDVVAKLKEQAAKLGANGVLLGRIGEKYSGSIGGSSYLGYGQFFGSSTAAYSKTIDAEAIYVPPQQSYGATQPETGAWPLQLPQFDVRASCLHAGGDVTACVNAEDQAHAWLAHHTTSVQIAGQCSVFAQQDQSYTMIEACVQQRERAQ